MEKKRFKVEYNKITPVISEQYPAYNSGYDSEPVSYETEAEHIDELWEQFCGTDEHISDVKITPIETKDNGPIFARVRKDIQHMVIPTSIGSYHEGNPAINNQKLYEVINQDDSATGKTYDDEYNLTIRDNVTGKTYKVMSIDFEFTN